MDYLKDLNPQQKEAVLAPPGANLVLAGAGSGKTRVIVHRILRLLEEGMAPDRILAITFTNKAAGEMRARLFVSPGTGARGIWVGTFHAVCARILRAEAEAAGLSPSFTIFSRGECLTLIRRCLAAANISEERYPPRSVLEQIGSRKTSLAEAGDSESPPFSIEATARKIAPAYERALREAGAVDFDDLLARPLSLFRRHPDVLRKYQERFEEILVDEYQDTNPVQDELVALLSRAHGRVFAVGDDDQGIYGWRGAQVENILQFERRFAGAQVFRLEENYRSSGAILGVASRIVGEAGARHEKRLFTRNPPGEAVCYLAAANPEEEAEGVIKLLMDAGAGGAIPWGDAAVFYRINTQSRPLEQAARRQGIPYQVVKGQRFFDRAEVQDLAAYLRLLIRPEDGEAFSRVINRPPRGLGAGRLKAIAGEGAQGVTVADAEAALTQGRIRGNAAQSLGDLLETIKALATLKAGPARLIEEALERTGYRAWMEGAVQRSTSPERRRAAARAMEGASEFVAAARAFEERIQEEEGVSPESDEAKVLFLEELALMGESDEMSGESGALSLMTLHAAKGLEFAAVGIVGVQEGLVPHSRSRDEPASLDEERRLLYVGVTRAKEYLSLSWAKERRPDGKKESWATHPSRFLEGVGPELIKRVGDHAPTKRRAPRDFRAPRDSTDSRYAEILSEAKTSRRPKTKDAPIVPAEALGPFAPGARVKHKKFGLGVIRKREGTGDRTTVNVEFENAGMKKLVLKYAPLSPADEGVDGGENPAV
ncbi:MAG: UvrD-helicase domain-containing protein [Nitrospinae bacterium]|nr:UvrD-helicase domain-containing protein [Nitrospinota bacterium]